MSMLSQLPIDVKIEVADFILDDISNLRYDNGQKLKLIQLIDQCIAQDTASSLLKCLLDADSLENLLNTYIRDAEDFLQDEAMRDD